MAANLYIPYLFQKLSEAEAETYIREHASILNDEFPLRGGRPTTILETCVSQHVPFYVFALLLKYGADPFKRLSNGRTVMDQLKEQRKLVGRRHILFWRDDAGGVDLLQYLGAAPGEDDEVEVPAKVVEEEKPPTPKKNTKYKVVPLLFAICDGPRNDAFQVLESMTKEELQKEFDLDDIGLCLNFTYNPAVKRTVGTAALIYLWDRTCGWTRCYRRRERIIELTSLLIEKGVSPNGIYSDSVSVMNGTLNNRTCSSLREIIQNCIMHRHDDPSATISVEMKNRFDQADVMFWWPGMNC